MLQNRRGWSACSVPTPIACPVSPPFPSPSWLQVWWWRLRRWRLRRRRPARQVRCGIVGWGAGGWACVTCCRPAPQLPASAPLPAAVLTSPRLSLPLRALTAGPPPPSARATGTAPAATPTTLRAAASASSAPPPATERPRAQPAQVPRCSHAPKPAFLGHPGSPWCQNWAAV